MANPPQAAELILRGLMPLDMSETVSGDLLEEYRESRVPAMGAFRADLWYWRQVGGMWLRAYWWLVASVVLLHVIHDVFDTFRAASGASYLDGRPTLVYAALSQVGLAGFVGLATVYGSWRSGRWQGGLVAAFGVSVTAWVFMAAWETATFHSFVHLQQANPYWIQAWQSSVHQVSLSAHGSEETFQHWVFWNGVVTLVTAGIVLLLAPLFFSGIGALVAETILSLPGGRQFVTCMLLGLAAVPLVAISLYGPRPVPQREVTLWAATGGPPLDFEVPRDGQVVAHMDLMGGLPPDIARIRISESATGATVWDVKPAPALRVCWNGCWNLALRAGANPASFAAGRQHFHASIPEAPTFLLTRGTAYLFEVWDSEGRVQRHGFTL
jgi:hypothetical protein